MVDEKIREFRCLQEELNTHRSDLGTLMAQRNENELVKQVGVGGHGHRSAFRFDCLISGAETEYIIECVRSSSCLDFCCCFFYSSGALIAE